MWTNLTGTKWTTGISSLHFLARVFKDLSPLRLMTGGQRSPSENIQTAPHVEIFTSSCFSSLSSLCVCVCVWVHDGV